MYHTRAGTIVLCSCSTVQTGAQLHNSPVYRCVLSLVVNHDLFMKRLPRVQSNNRSVLRSHAKTYPCPEIASECCMENLISLRTSFIVASLYYAAALHPDPCFVPLCLHQIPTPIYGHVGLLTVRGNRFGSREFRTEQNANVYQYSGVQP